MKPIFFVIGLILIAGIAVAGSTEPEPAGQDRAPSALIAPIQFFQDYVSAADGRRCPMTPSCSAYAKAAMKRNGVLMGWIMACDRLMRCGGDEIEHCPHQMTRDGVRCQDPVENNDFWWR